MTNKYPLPPVQAPEDWAIQKISLQKEEIIQDTILRTILKVEEDTGINNMTLEAQIAKTMFLEKIRIKEEPWSIDPKDEASFWRHIKNDLIRNERLSQDQKSQDLENRAVLREVVERYAKEIIGHFDMETFNFARSAVPLLFSRLLSAANAKSLKHFFTPSSHISQKIHLSGEIESIRALAKEGTVVLLPTHSSNLDSILIGWAIDALGLPPFIYGAGLNLFNSRIFGYFMNRLGAYKVDRRKRNLIYNETLKTYSTIALQAGCHSLFFPGGTRSRSGALENRLKLGLMGTAVEAQRLNYTLKPEEKGNKIFVVPLVISYHFVLEAPSLIVQHLNNMGQDKFYIKDESSSYWEVLKFIWKLFSKGSEMELSFGKPMDVFGNFVDDKGISYDQTGRAIDTVAYFRTKGIIREDSQRDIEYTRMLGDKVVERYKAENVVFSSHIVAFAGFQLLQKTYRELDLYSLLRMPADDRSISKESMLLAVERLITQLRKMESKGEVRLANHLDDNVARILEHGINHLGLYNERNPLYFASEKSLQSQSLNVLFFYHNRLTGYGLESFIPLITTQNS